MKFDLARFFDRQREIIEAAETPFAKLAIFILPILAPIVPASLTGLHLYKLFTDVFKFSPEWSATLSIIIAIVLEMLGYVGAISFIQAVFRLVKTRNALYILPSVLNGLAYLFYLALMFLVNYKLGEFFQTPQIINTIVGLLSFVTVPTGLLAANYLSQKEMKEEDREEKVSRKDERLKKYEIKHGKVSRNLPESSVTYQKDVEKVSESSESFPKDWRKLRKVMSEKDMRDLANLSADGIRKVSQKYNVDERTVINWRINARKELGIN
jgi:glucan phosphoethanolaminetransferase (alkaline phosphatase superfamily)